jgi:MFS family permease
MHHNLLSEASKAHRGHRDRLLFAKWRVLRAAVDAFTDFAGLCASAIFITATTLIQHETPHELLGRVMSCLMSLVAGSQVISMFVAGPVAEKIGIPNLYYGSAAMLVGIGVVGYFKLPKVEKAEAEKAELAKTG